MKEEKKKKITFYLGNKNLNKIKKQTNKNTHTKQKQTKQKQNSNKKQKTKQKNKTKKNKQTNKQTAHISISYRRAIEIQDMLFEALADYLPLPTVCLWMARVLYCCCQQLPRERATIACSRGCGRVVLDA